MTKPTTHPERVRIYTHLTRTRFLHIEDSLERGKLRIFAGIYAKGQAASSLVYAFFDVLDARVVLSDLSVGNAVDFEDFKGGTTGAGASMARVLKIKTKENKHWVSLVNGPGVVMGPGAIKPGPGPAVAVDVPFTPQEARRMAMACLAYVQAWDVAQALRRVRLVLDPHQVPE